ncbi:hypothetical protein ACEE97_05880 [Limosilactobacillus reuteri]|jgi:hypothetical protein|uniref:hypothetical protein n=1 Tax=Limosilactobacillus reuteri TaxID=1598 RepID=UPI00254FB888|nr:hypothetical protein [Limosilactobacillus reuteri]MDK8117375.1 hypothetical protein [Limosilactobacillus reuteri]MDY6043675.1 hypothetical protein [Lactobacillus johnsonii]
MRKKFIRNKPLFYLTVVLIILDIVIYYIWIKTNIFKNIVTVNQTLGRSLITIDTVLIGFSYTALNTMLSFSNSNDFNIIDRDGYIDKYYNGVYISIALFFIAMIFGVITGYSNLGEKRHWIFMIQFLINLDAIFFFGLTLIRFRSLINWVRRRKIEKLKKSAE